MNQNSLVITKSIIFTNGMLYPSVIIFSVNAKKYSSINSVSKYRIWSSSSYLLLLLCFRVLVLFIYAFFQTKKNQICLRLPLSYFSIKIAHFQLLLNPTLHPLPNQLSVENTLTLNHTQNSPTHDHTHQQFYNYYRWNRSRFLDLPKVIFVFVIGVEISWCLAVVT